MFSNIKIKIEMNLKYLIYISNILHNLRLGGQKIANLRIKGYLKKQLKESTQKAKNHLGIQLTSSIIRKITTRHHDPLSVSAKVEKSSIMCCMFGVSLEVHCHHHQVVKPVL